MKTVKLLIAVVMPLALIAGAAHAAPPKTAAATGKVAPGKQGAKRLPFGLLRAAEKSGALSKGTVANLEKLQATVRNCFKNSKAKDKVAKKAECRIHRGPFVKAQREATNDAHVKATGPLKAKLKKNLDWLKTTRERMKQNAAKAGQKI